MELIDYKVLAIDYYRAAENPWNVLELAKGNGVSKEDADALADFIRRSFEDRPAHPTVERAESVPPVKYPIPDQNLTATIEALREFYTRLEIEAAALATLKSPEAERLAQERLKDAEMAEKLFEFYLSL